MVIKAISTDKKQKSKKDKKANAEDAKLKEVFSKPKTQDKKTKTTTRPPTVFDLTLNSLVIADDFSRIKNLMLLSLVKNKHEKIKKLESSILKSTDEQELKGLFKKWKKIVQKISTDESSANLWIKQVEDQLF